MRRFWLVITMLGMFGAGIGMGSIMTPGARADKPVVTPAAEKPVAATVVTPVQDGFPGPGTITPLPGTYGQGYYGYPYGVPVRWQIVTIPIYGTANTQTILLDTFTGESWLWQADRAIGGIGYSWQRVPKI